MLCCRGRGACGGVTRVLLHLVATVVLRVGVVGATRRDVTVGARATERVLCLCITVILSRFFQRETTCANHTAWCLEQASKQHKVHTCF